MRYYISLIALAVIGIAIFTACRNASTTSTTSATATRTDSAEPVKPGATETPRSNSNSQTEDPLAKIPRISLADAKKAFDEGNVVFVDTRSDVKYKEEHVKGAINIPAESFQTRYAEVPKDKKIITYCS